MYGNRIQKKAFLLFIKGESLHISFYSHDIILSLQLFPRSCIRIVIIPVT